jgi:hypothetical protein
MCGMFTAWYARRPEQNGFKPLDCALALQKRRFSHRMIRGSTVGQPIVEPASSETVSL